jgi:hypothetical protein
MIGGLQRPHHFGARRHRTSMCGIGIGNANIEAAGDVAELAGGTAETISAHGAQHHQADRA